MKILQTSADMAELADALVLGSSVHDVQVRVLLSAPKGAFGIRMLFFSYSLLKNNLQIA